jgi:putative Ca2+/H+ antiporter (TMEM165/GDT1 family)
MCLLCIFLLLGTAAAQDDPDQDSYRDSYDSKPKAEEIKPEVVISSWSAFIAAITSIIVSELGDKTFFIAAIMSMRYNRIAVFAGAILALVLMTGISTAFGWIVPILIPPRITQIIVTVLFFFFGAKLLYDVYNDDGKGEHDEAAEAEEEIDKAHSQLIKKKDSQDPNADIELKTTDDNSEIQMMVNKDDPENPTATTTKKSVASKIAVAFIFWQALTMTFLGEWGDRSQIATIALASQSSAPAVFLGASLGHALCTGLAVIGGKYLAKSISERYVNLSGGLLFLVFGIHNLFSI